MLSRKPLLWAFAALALFAAVTGCSKDEDLAPVFTRVEANVECGYAPVDVQFLAIASGGNPKQDPTGANDYLDVTWDFGDDSSGNGSVTSHRFTEPALYEVRVTVTDDDGDSATETLSLEVRADSLLVGAPNDTTVVAGLGTFSPPTPRATNGGTATNVKSGLSINEVLVFNQTGIQHTTGVRLPYLELYNSTDQDIELGGSTPYRLAMDLYNTELQHTFGNATRVTAGEHQIIWLKGPSTNVAEPRVTWNILKGAEEAEYVGAPEDWPGATIYLIRAGRIVDEFRLGPQQADVSVGRLADGGLDGTLPLTMTCDLCGFDPEAGDYSRFQYRWFMNDAMGTVYDGRSPTHLFRMEDVGVVPVLLRVYDTQTSVYRTATINVTVTAP
ncbi:MAG TPA: PKD domain-containing protein [Candidatus Krumholzibacteria bacterium]|nr:PKD domain-containing protein [Candidatus Krumholzibacteria bacterium]HRX50365.1 PKD domain-containing protein [Candidatus Krumholzibacteria bacterium]